MSLIAFWPKPSSLVFIFVFLPAQVLDDMLPASKRTEMLDLEELIEEKVGLRMLSLDLFLIEERGNLNEETFKGNEIENSFQKKLQVEGEKVQDTAEQTSWNQGNQLIHFDWLWLLTFLIAGKIEPIDEDDEHNSDESNVIHIKMKVNLQFVKKCRTEYMI